MLNVTVAGNHLHGKKAVLQAVAGDVFDGVFLCCPVFPRDVLDDIWDLIESASEGFFYLLLSLNFGIFITESPVRRKSSLPFIG